MDFTCLRCLNNIQAFDTNHSNSFLEENKYSIQRLNCIQCEVCVALRISNSWKSVERWLQCDKIKNGWLPANSSEDHRIVFIMSQILYNTSADDAAPLFDMPDIEDVCKIFWQNGCAFGYYSAKLKGAVVYATREVYTTLTLDTAYILPTCRRKGLGISMLKDLLSSFPGEDLAISTPISKSMAHVLYKFLQKEPQYRTKLWEIEGTGSVGCKKLLYYTLKGKLC